MQLTIPSFAATPDRAPKPHGYSLDSGVAREFSEACRADGRKQTAVLEALMRAYIASVKESPCMCNTCAAGVFDIVGRHDWESGVRG